MKTRLESTGPRQAGRRKAKQLANVFAKKMRTAGFNVLTSQNIDDTLRANGFLHNGQRSGVIRSDELVFNRGTGADSNFFVFCRIGKDRLTLFYTNPTDYTKGIYSSGELYVQKEIPISINPNNGILNHIIENITEMANKKDPGDYRYQIHFHMHHILDKNDPIYDDGGSSGVSILRRLMIYNMDGFAPTPHNSVEPEMYKIFSLAAKVLHMTYVPGLELTATLYESNGPHHVVLFRSARDAELFKDRILSDRKESEMPPYFIPRRDDYNIFSIYKELRKMKNEKRLATFVAHPVIQEDKRLPLYVTGLMSSIVAGTKLKFFDTGEIRLLHFNDAIDLARENEGVSIYNESLKANQMMVITNQKLRAYLGKELSLFRWKFGNPSKISPKLATYLVGRRLARELRLNTMFESDDHETKPLVSRDTPYYIAGGDKFGAGYTRIYMSGKLRKKLNEENRILTTKEFVEGLLDKSVRTKAYIFARVDENGIFQVAEERRNPTKGYNYKTTWKIRLRRWRTYIHGIGGAVLELLAEGKINVMKYLTK